MKRLTDFIKKEEFLYFLKYFGLFLLLFLAVASIALRRVIQVEANPFFYERF